MYCTFIHICIVHSYTYVLYIPTHMYCIFLHICNVYSYTYVLYIPTHTYVLYIPTHTYVLYIPTHMYCTFLHTVLYIQYYDDGCQSNSTYMQHFTNEIRPFRLQVYRNVGEEDGSWFQIGSLKFHNQSGWERLNIVCNVWGFRLGVGRWLDD